jgi:hypothetical protein
VRIELILNPGAEDFGPLQSDLQSEINALANQAHGVRVSSERVPPPPGTLVVDEVFRFIVEHQEEIKAGSGALIFLKALLETARAVVGRRKGATPSKKPEEKKEEPSIIIVVNDGRLELPSSADKEKAFLKALENPRAPKLLPRRRSPRESRERTSRRRGFRSCRDRRFSLQTP